jgi:hypothetical protein
MLPLSLTFLSMKRFYFTLLAMFAVVAAWAENPETDVATTAGDGEAAVEQVLTPNQARQQRGFSTDECFVPKGQWIFGGTASYSMHKNDNYKFLVVDNIDSDGYTVNVSPMVAYAVGKNMAVGVRFGYGRTLLALDNASVSVSGNDFSVDYFHRIKHSYTGTIFWRPYIPLGYSNRFAVYAEVQLNVSGGQSKVVAENGVIDGIQNYAGTYSKNFGASIALQPGIVAFVTNNTALELSIGVFGIGVDRIKQIKNQVETGEYLSSDMNFKLNFLSVGFGVSFYL